MIVEDKIKDLVFSDNIEDGLLGLQLLLNEYKLDYVIGLFSISGIFKKSQLFLSKFTTIHYNPNQTYIKHVDIYDDNEPKNTGPKKIGLGEIGYIDKENNTVITYDKSQ